MISALVYHHLNLFNLSLVEAFSSKIDNLRRMKGVRSQELLSLHKTYIHLIMLGIIIPSTMLLGSLTRADLLIKLYERKSSSEVWTQGIYRVYARIILCLWIPWNYDRQIFWAYDMLENIFIWFLWKHFAIVTAYFCACERKVRIEVTLLLW